MAEEKQVLNDYKEFIEYLNNNKVEYLIVGAYAAIAHTNIPRRSKDIDFWIRKDKENAINCSKAIKEFSGIDINYKDLLSDRYIVFIGTVPNRIDILNSQGNINFKKAWKKKCIGTFKGVKTYYISKDDLIKLKKYYYREIDQKDLQRLKNSNIEIKSINNLKKNKRH